MAGAALALLVTFVAKANRSSAKNTFRVEQLDSHVASWIDRIDSLQFVRLEVAGTDDFLQLSAAPGAIELDYPQMTSRQRELGPMFRHICNALGLRVRESTGSEGSLFLDADVPRSSSSLKQAIEALLVGMFGVVPETKLVAVAVEE